MTIEFGSKEWMDKVRENTKFPSVMAFYVSHENKGVYTSYVETKAQNVGDLKYSKVAPYSKLENGESLALLGVKRIHSAEQYLEVTKEFKDKWGVSNA